MRRITHLHGSAHFTIPLNQQATSCPSTECLVGQIQVRRSSLVVATNQMSDHTKSSITSIDSNITDNIIKKISNV